MYTRYNPHSHLALLVGHTVLEANVLHFILTKFVSNVLALHDDLDFITILHSLLNDFLSLSHFL